MQVSFIKTSHTEYTLRCVRDDGTVTESTLVARSFLVHDLVHLAYEREAGCSEAFFGSIACGQDLAALMPKAMRAAQSAPSGQLMVAEMVVGPIQGALKSRSSSEDVYTAIAAYFEATMTTLPMPLSPALIDRVRAWVHGELERYRGLKTGERLDFAFP